MSWRSPSRTAAGLAAAALGALLGCSIEPEVPELRYELSERVLAENPELAEDEVAQDHLRGALEMLFGTPSNPGFLLTEDMLDEELDPNYGALELTDAEWEALVADNEARHADTIAALREGRFDDVRLPREYVDLRADWQALGEELEELEAGGEETAAELEELRAYVTEEWPLRVAEYYPTLRESAEMYRQQCLHCHGVEGGGDGPTAPYLDPLPRDYRQGIFKFTALSDKARPRRADLFRTLAEGVYTTAMPSFRRFSDAQLHGLVDYVRLLSMRGRVELLTALDYDPDEGGITIDSVMDNYASEWETWEEAEDYVIAYAHEVPPATPETIARGRELYMDVNGANCVKCHGPEGRGDGDGAWEVDLATGERRRITDDWGNPISPRDLTRDVYRFGRRPIDLFRRISAGINGTPMPAQTTLTHPETGDRLLSDEDLWAIVHYVRSLSSHGPQPVAARGTEAHADDDGHGEGTR